MIGGRSLVFALAALCFSAVPKARAEALASYVIFSPAICTGICPAKVLWLHGDGATIVATFEFEVPHMHATAAAGPDLAPRVVSLPRDDVEVMLASIEAVLVWMPCDREELEFPEDTNTYVTWVREGECVGAPLPLSVAPEFLVLSCWMQVAWQGVEAQELRCADTLPEARARVQAWPR